MLEPQMAQCRLMIIEVLGTFRRMELKKLEGHQKEFKKDQMDIKRKSIGFQRNYL